MLGTRCAREEARSVGALDVVEGGIVGAKDDDNRSLGCGVKPEEYVPASGLGPDSAIEGAPALPFAEDEPPPSESQNPASASSELKKSVRSFVSTLGRRNAEREEAGARMSRSAKGFGAASGGGGGGGWNGGSSDVGTVSRGTRPAKKLGKGRDPFGSGCWSGRLGRA